MEEREEYWGDSKTCQMSLEIADCAPGEREREKGRLLNLGGFQNGGSVGRSLLYTFPNHTMRLVREDFEWRGKRRSGERAA